MSVALLSIHPLEGPWVAGAYQLTLQVDDRTYQCAIGIPDNFWEPGSQLNVDCAPKLELDLGPSSSCRYMDDTPEAISGACMTSNRVMQLHPAEQSSGSDLVRALSVQRVDMQRMHAERSLATRCRRAA